MSTLVDRHSTIALYLKVISCVGPAILLIALLLGARAMGGFAGGSHQNSGLQDTILWVGLVACIACVLIVPAITLVLGFTDKTNSNNYAKIGILSAALNIMAPVLIVVITQ